MTAARDTLAKMAINKRDQAKECENLRKYFDSIAVVLEALVKGASDEICNEAVEKMKKVAPGALPS